MENIFPKVTFNICLEPWTLLRRKGEAMLRTSARADLPRLSGQLFPNSCGATALHYSTKAICEPPRLYCDLGSYEVNFLNKVTLA